MGQRELRPKQPQIHFKVTRELQDQFYAAVRLRDGLTMTDVFHRFMKKYVDESKHLLDAYTERYAGE